MVPHEIVLFLRLVRDAHAANRLVYRRSRDKNLDTLLALGWLPSEMLDHVAGLRRSRLCAHPGRTDTQATPRRRCASSGQARKAKTSTSR